jgi:hypothetical protein
MTRGTRFFLAGSAVIVVLGLGTGLVAYYNGNLPLGLGRGDDKQLAYLPADAAAVGYADVRTIMDSQFRQKLRQTMPAGEELAKFKDELGVDIEHDIDSVICAYMGGDPTSEHHAVVVVRGRFNDGQIETMATQHGMTASTYNGKKMLSMTMHEGMGQTAPTATIAFLEPGVLALGDGPTVQRAIDAGASGTDVRKNAELMAVIDDVRGSGNAWFVGKLDAMKANSPIPQEISQHLPPVNVVAASVHINGGLRGSLRADAIDDKSAEQLRDVVKGALAAGHLMTGQNPKIEAMLNSLQITGSGKSVGVSFTVPTELLDVINGAAAAHNLSSGDAAKRIHK